MQGAKAEGKRYERKFGKHLKGVVAEEDGDLLSGQWLEFEDGNGEGWAQPDYTLVKPNLVVIFECKLTQHPNARLQLEHLYLPLVQFIWDDCEVQLVEVFKNMTEVPLDPTRLVASYEDLMMNPRINDTFLWHWLGR